MRRESALPVAITRALMAGDPGRFTARTGRCGSLSAMLRCHCRNPAPPIFGDRCNRRDRAMEPRALPALTLIDPELGRLVVGQNRTGPVRISCNFARACEIGGGEQSRRASLASVEDAVPILPADEIAAAVGAAGEPSCWRKARITSWVRHHRARWRPSAHPGRRWLLPTVAIPGIADRHAGARRHAGTERAAPAWRRYRGAGSHRLPSTLVLRDCTLVPGLDL